MKILVKKVVVSTVVALLLSRLLLGLGAATKNQATTDSLLERLQGKWDGAAMAKKTQDGPIADSVEAITVTVTSNSFHFYRDTNFWFDTTIVLPPGTDPQQLHATIKSNSPSQGTSSIGKLVVAIVKVEGGTLTLATRGDGLEGPPIAFEDENALRYELRKAQPKKSEFNQHGPK